MIVMEIILTTKEDLRILFKELLEENKQKQINTSTKSKEEFLTKKQAASLLKVSLATIDNYRRNNLIPSHRIGNNVRFKKSELISSVTDQG
jgi:excisionase family DNA binding protein